MVTGSAARIGVNTPFLIAHTVLEHPAQGRATACCLRLLDRGHQFVVCPTVIDEFLHVVTDPKRFESPLSIDRAVHIARTWMNNRETQYCVPTKREPAAAIRVDD